MFDSKYIQKVVQELLEGGDLFLVDVSVSRTNLIKVFVDHPDGISLDECSRISRELRERINSDQEDFELQVSSPGLGKPLKVLPQYRKLIGKNLQLILTDGESLKGELMAIQEEQDLSRAMIEIKPGKSKKNPDPASVWINLENISSAKVELKF